MTLKNIDICIMSVLFASPCNQIVFYKLYKCAIKDNIFLCAYYKELSYLEYTLLRHTFNSHNLFVNSYKLSNNYNTYYVLTFRIDKEMRKQIDLVKNGYYDYLSSKKKCLFEFDK